MNSIEVHVSLLGGFGIAVGEPAVPEGAWRLRKAKSVIKVLALAPEHLVHRERMCELLWPDRDPGAAANNLHQALYVARRALDAARPGASDWLVLREDSLELMPAWTWVDVEAYETATAAARAEPSLDRYRGALELYGGELLPEDRYEEWTVAPRRALQELQLGMLLETAELHRAGGDRAGALEALHQAVLHDPFDEEAHRRLIRVYAESGRRQQALAQYQQLRQSLRREFGAEPDPETRRLYQAILSGRYAVAPASEEQLSAAAGPARRGSMAAARTDDRQADNLPLQLTSFIGREAEIADVALALTNTRLLTLTGPGGGGKTRLSLEVAAGLVHRFEHGAWLVELAGLSSPELVVSQVGTVLGLDVRSEHDPAEVLIRQLRERELLLVIDNCEHLLAAVAELASRLLSSCPRLKILATSREPLRAEGEVAWQVPPLPLPAPGAPIVRAELERFPAIRLFCERAAAMRADFVLTDDNAAAIADICWRLDGVPLAIELAAARTRVLSPAQIAERLGDALTLLSSGPRGTVSRQRTLEETLRWSHQLLDEPEQVLFRRLSVFAGTFALDAVEGVCADQAGETASVLDQLERLVDRSLVMAEEYAGGYRYRILETIRQYARVRLREANEEWQIEDMHRAWCVRFAAQNDPHGVGGPPRVPATRLELEHDNLRAAMATGLVRDPDAALRLAAHLFAFWMMRGYFVEGASWTEDALARSADPTPTRADALHAACGFAVRRGTAGRSVSRAEEAVAIQRGLGEPRALGIALERLAAMLWSISSHSEAEAALAELERLVAQQEMPDIQAGGLHAHSLLAHTRADYRLAARQLEASIALMAEVPDRVGSVYWVSTPGLALVDDLGTGRPRLFFEETLLLFRRVPSRFAVPYLRCDLARATRADGDLDAARDVLEEALSEFREAGDDAGVAFALNALGNQARTEREFELARDALEEALAIRERIGDQRAIRITLGNLGILAARAGDIERGRMLLERAEDLSTRADDRAAANCMVLSLGNIELDAGEPERAIAVLEEAERRLDRQLIARGVGWARQALAEALIEIGDAERAADQLERARQCFSAVGDAAGLATVELPLSSG